MEALIPSKFKAESAENYTAPTNYFKLPSDQGGNGKKTLYQIGMSVSGYGLALIANLHNGIMSSKTLPWAAKVIVVILLDIVALKMSAFAAAELTFRISAFIILSPFYLIGVYVWYDTNEDRLSALVHLPRSLLDTAIQTLNAYYTVCLLTFAKRNIEPENTTTNVLSFVTCRRFS